MSYCCLFFVVGNFQTQAEGQKERIGSFADQKGVVPKDSLESQIQSLFGNASYNVADDGTIASLSGKTLGLGLTEPDTIDRIYQFFELYKELFQIENPREELSVLRFARNQYGYHSIKFEQMVRGVKVRYSGFIVSLCPDTSFIDAVNGMIHPQARSVNTVPDISADQAIIIAKADPAHGDSVTYANKPELLIAKVGDIYHLVWKLGIGGGGYHGSASYLIDAHTGEILEVKCALR